METRNAAWFRRAAAAERAKAAEATRRAELWDRTAAELEDLKAGEQHLKVSNSMTNAHRLALSGAHAPKDEFVAVLNAAGYSIRSLATDVGVSQATLNAHRKPKTDRNSRPIPQERADKVAKLTKSKEHPKGWPADAAHWPCGISS